LPGGPAVLDVSERGSGGAFSPRRRPPGGPVFFPSSGKKKTVLPPAQQQDRGPREPPVRFVLDRKGFGVRRPKTGRPLPFFLPPAGEGRRFFFHFFFPIRGAEKAPRPGSKAAPTVFWRARGDPPRGPSPPPRPPPIFPTSKVFPLPPRGRGRGKIQGVSFFLSFFRLRSKFGAVHFRVGSLCQKKKKTGEGGEKTGTPPAFTRARPTQTPTPPRPPTPPPHSFRDFFPVVFGANRLPLGGRGVCLTWALKTGEALGTS